MAVINIDEALKNELGLDDRFQFECKGCGRCCKNRHDITLKPRDLFRICKYLGREPLEVVARYCEVYPGAESRFPMLVFKAEGPTQHCPFLRGKKCSIHSAKPEVCAMFPLGRFFSVMEPELGTRYFVQDVPCGDKAKSHTVREWLGHFDIPEDDTFFTDWNNCALEVMQYLRELHKQNRSEEEMALFQEVFANMYLHYDMALDFETQFEQNSKKLLQSLKEKFGG